MDEAKRQALVALLEPHLDDQECYNPSPLVPLELFFDGNDDQGSLGCNLLKHPGIGEFYSTLSVLKSDPAVSGAWVIAKQHDWKPAWPHSDEVVIRTSLSAEDIAARLEHLQPDTVDAVATLRSSLETTGTAIECAEGEHFVVAWWD